MTDESRGPLMVWRYAGGFWSRMVLPLPAVETVCSDALPEVLAAAGYVRTTDGRGPDFGALAELWVLRHSAECPAEWPRWVFRICPDGLTLHDVAVFDFPSLMGLSQHLGALAPHGSSPS